MSLDKAKEQEVWEVGTETKRCSAEGEVLVDAHVHSRTWQMGFKYLALTPRSVGSVSPVCQQGLWWLTAPKSSCFG